MMNANTFHQQDVDFLPPEYRQQHARRRKLGQQVLIGAIVVGLVAVASAGQACWAKRVRREMDALTPQCERVAAQTAELNKLQAELQVAQAEAQLLTYLRHPWPCTQLLAALTAPLPDSITFREIRIGRQANRAAELMDRAPRLDRQALEKMLAQLPRAGRDLKTLRDQCDHAPLAISLLGLASDSAAVYRYLDELSKHRLLAKVDLVSLENASHQQDQLEFKVAVLVRPGYGLPDGPKGLPPETPAATRTASGGATKGGQP
jgi:Tfp pilus assembly protein PilN